MSSESSRAFAAGDKNFKVEVKDTGMAELTSQTLNTMSTDSSRAFASGEKNFKVEVKDTGIADPHAGFLLDFTDTSGAGVDIDNLQISIQVSGGGISNQEATFNAVTPLTVAEQGFIVKIPWGSGYQSGVSTNLTISLSATDCTFDLDNSGSSTKSYPVTTQNNFGAGTGNATQYIPNNIWPPVASSSNGKRIIIAENGDKYYLDTSDRVFFLSKGKWNQTDFSASDVDVKEGNYAFWAGDQSRYSVYKAPISGGLVGKISLIGSMPNNKEIKKLAVIQSSSDKIFCLDNTSNRQVYYYDDALDGFYLTNLLCIDIVSQGTDLYWIESGGNSIRKSSATNYRNMQDSSVIVATLPEGYRGTYLYADAQGRVWVAANAVNSTTKELWFHESATSGDPVWIKLGGDINGIAVDNLEGGIPYVISNSATNKQVLTAHLQVTNA